MISITINDTSLLKPWQAGDNRDEVRQHLVKKIKVFLQNIVKSD